MFPLLNSPVLGYWPKSVVSESVMNHVNASVVSENVMNEPVSEAVLDESAIQDLSLISDLELDEPSASMNDYLNSESIYPTTSTLSIHGESTITHSSIFNNHIQQHGSGTKFHDKTLFGSYVAVIYDTQALWGM